MTIYVDTSAAMKLIVEEEESAALAHHLEERKASGDELVSSLLTHTELHCAANRRPDHITHTTVSEVLSTFALVDMENADLTTAPLLPGRLRSADAIHLATALRLQVGIMVAYDTELCAAAELAGIGVSRPGARLPG